MAEIFGFSVDYNDGTVFITDSRLTGEQLPEGLNIYIANGVKYLYAAEAERFFAEKGMTGRLFDYGSPDQYARFCFGYYLEPTDKIGQNPYGSCSVPYFNNADTPEGAQAKNEIYLMYDYFANMGLL